MNIVIDNIRLPYGNLSISGGPSFNDKTSENGGGWRYTNANWAYPLWEWTVQFKRKLSEFHPVVAFWLCREGNSRGFLMHDPFDHDDGGHGRVALVNGVYRLVKDYLDGEVWQVAKNNERMTYRVGDYVRPSANNGYYYRATGSGVVGATEPIWPTSGTVSDGTVTWEVAGAVKKFSRLITRPVKNSVSFTGGGTLDYLTGIVTGGSVGTWAGDFDVPVTFAIDKPIFERDPKGNTEWVSVQIKELRV